jgi:hypothetical protein
MEIDCETGKKKTTSLSENDNNRTNNVSDWLE